LLFKLLKRNSADRINFEDFSTHEFLIENKPSRIEEMADNFKSDLKIMDDENESWNTASKLKCTLKNNLDQVQSKNCLINKTLKDSFQDQDIICKYYFKVERMFRLI
jgi:hypothetical protein